jgi:HSP20 family molecular chaperone IbpA
MQSYYYWRIFVAERAVTPNVCMFNDDRCETLNIQINLPGIQSSDAIDFSFLEDGFFVIAKAEDQVYKGSFALPGPVQPDKAIAEFANGLLTVNVPYMMAGQNITRLKID